MAPRGIDKMAGHELRRIFLVPFKCPHCGTENDGAAAWAIEHGKLRCQNTVCGRDYQSLARPHHFHSAASAVFPAAWVWP